MTQTPNSSPGLQASPAFALIIIGDEILSGKRADKHLPKVIELLHARGLQLAHADYVGDSPERITQTLARAFAGDEMVFSCGGIGATPDDHTRQCAARALGTDLVLHHEAELLIRERMQDLAREQGTLYEPDRSDNIHRLNMGVFPRGAQIIPNPYNKIPGFYCSAKNSSSAGPSQAARAPLGGSDPRARSTSVDPGAVGERGGTVFFVPGFPVMAWPMIEWVLDTHYRHLFRSEAWVERSVIVFGAMEAALTPLMEEIERLHTQVKVFSLPSVDHPQYGRHIELGVKGSPEQVSSAYPALISGLNRFGATLGPELVRN
jgi:molybdopterin-biosynthesis enzyme MoeA-like protein